MQEPLKKNKAGDVVPRIDLSPAESFGELHYLLDWSDMRRLSMEQLVWKIRRGLQEYSDIDYIVMLGSPTAMWLAGAIAAENNQGCVRTLEWDNNRGCYNVVVTNLHCQPE